MAGRGWYTLHATFICMSTLLKKLPRSFYLRPTITVARDLLGRYLVRNIGTTRLIGKIVEVEAYLGERDPASHTFRGRTKRNEVMFWEGGHLYVYFTYGMHFCANIVTEKAGIGHAVLVRAVEPIEGIQAMRRRRGLKKEQTRPHQITGGPAKFCQAFRISRAENGTDLTGTSIHLTTGTPVPPGQIRTSRRIGISRGREKRLRFYISGAASLSRNERSPTHIK